MTHCLSHYLTQSDLNGVCLRLKEVVLRIADFKRLVISHLVKQTGASEMFD